MKPNIAIDGPAGAGKSTVARKLAEKLGFLYIDTGAMYRALTYCALKKGIDINNPDELTELAENVEIFLTADEDGQMRVYCCGEDVTSYLRDPKVSQCVSKVAEVPGVRRRMVELQRKMASAGGVIMDGRDIGTYVLPDAQLKFFITADLEERARRRLKDLEKQGYIADLEEVKKEIAMRDAKDSSRAVAPLKKAEDAVLIDTTNLTVDEVLQLIFKISRERIKDDV
ncbi:MAG TPA: (d)CMP kinase [Peptococcaceae bacterium]|nr:MAG: Cytidylate kinase [Clostridia bacterium 41_269]HBT20515.1 (d)CMP kinase [Peptococcaceae bacterium]